MAPENTPRPRMTLKMILSRMGIIIGVTVVIQIGLMFIPQQGLFDISKYQEILDKCDMPELVAHFPKQVTLNEAEASKTKLFFIKGALGQGGELQLRMPKSSQEIQQLATTLNESVSWQYQGGDMLSHFNLDKKNNVPTTYCHTNDDKKNYIFSNDYTLYVIEAKDLALAETEAWTHGHTRGIAVNTIASDVIYWIKKW